MFSFCDCNLFLTSVRSSFCKLSGRASSPFLVFLLSFHTFSGWSHHKQMQLYLPEQHHITHVTSKCSKGSGCQVAHSVFKTMTSVNILKPNWVESVLPLQFLYLNLTWVLTLKIFQRKRNRKCGVCFTKVLYPLPLLRVGAFLHFTQC